jgi:hypothetical protein
MSAARLVKTGVWILRRILPMLYIIHVCDSPSAFKSETMIPFSFFFLVNGDPPSFINGTCEIFLSSHVFLMMPLPLVGKNRLPLFFRSMFRCRKAAT